MAFAVVGVALQQVFQRYAVVGENQFFLAAMFSPVRFNMARHGFDVRREIVVMGNKPEIGQPAPPGKVFCNGIER